MSTGSWTMRATFDGFAKMPTRVEQAPPADDQSARDTRQRLREVLEQYPPSVGQVLRLDPSLISRGDYLAPYPTLAAFLQQHPDIQRNPVYFFGETRFDTPE